MQKSYRFVIPRTGQTVDLVLDIDVDAVAEKFYAAGVRAGRAMALKEVQQKLKELAK